MLDRIDTERVAREVERSLEPARGDVLEIGSGTGSNLERWPDAVRSVTAVERSPGMNRRARERFAGSPLPTRLVAGDATALPFPDASFDTVGAVFVLCTIDDSDAALAEARRVLRPDGRLVFYEHVAAPELRLRKWQRRLEPVHRRIACGCRLTRDTETAIRRAGFDIDGIERGWIPDAPRLLGWSIRGTAAPALQAG